MILSLIASHKTYPGINVTKGCVISREKYNEQVKKIQKNVLTKGAFTRGQIEDRQSNSIARHKQKIASKCNEKDDAAYKSIIKIMFV